MLVNNASVPSQKTVTQDRDDELIVRLPNYASGQTYTPGPALWTKTNARGSPFPTAPDKDFAGPKPAGNQIENAMKTQIDQTRSQTQPLPILGWVGLDYDFLAIYPVTPRTMAD